MRSDDEQVNEIESLRERISELESTNAALRNELSRDIRRRLESECVSLRAEVERLRAERKERDDMWHRRQENWRSSSDRCLKAAESRLAAANALLGKIQQWERAQCKRQVAENPWSCLMNELDAHLAAQPATAPDYDPITAPVPPGDINGPHGELPRPTAPTLGLCPPGDYEHVYIDANGAVTPAAPTRTEAEQRVLDAAVDWRTKSGHRRS